MNSSILWHITPCSPLKVTGVSEEYVASIFRVEYAKQETSVKQLTRMFLRYIPEDKTLHKHQWENFKGIYKYLKIRFVSLIQCTISNSRITDVRIYKF
jgi:hypothetical protein